MKRFPYLAFLLGFVGAAALAQSTYTPTPAVRSTSVTGSQLATGTVLKYAAGQSITVRAGDGKEYELALEPKVRVDGSVVEGKLAAIMWTIDSAGKARVMSITAAPGSAMDIERSAPSVPSPRAATPRPNRTSGPAGAAAGTAPASGPKTTPMTTPTPGSRPDQFPSPGPSPKPTPAAQ